MTINDELRAMRERADKAGDHVGKLCVGEDRWKMSVPVRDDDSDVMLTRVTDIDLPRLLDAVERVVGLHRPMGAEDEMFCAECGDYDPRTPAGAMEYPCATLRVITEALDS